MSGLQKSLYLLVYAPDKSSFSSQYAYSILVNRSAVSIIRNVFFVAAYYNTKPVTIQRYGMHLILY